MHVICVRGAFAVGLLALSAAQLPAQEAGSIVDGIDIDILFNYYDQDGDHSPVTGGVGTEELSVISPVFILKWSRGGPWNWQVDLGADSITSASTDNIDLGEARVSAASRVDARVFTSIAGTRNLEKQKVGFVFGFSGEYDYQSIKTGVTWARDYREQNTSLAASLVHYQDNVEQYGIDGIDRGDESRSTTDLSLSLTQVLGPRTVGSVELSLSEQSGFLSTPFHEVVLAPTATFPDGEHVAERLPDSRQRTAIGLRLNHAFSKRFVVRASARYYDDDWGLDAITFELEPHFRIGSGAETWIYPIFRFHSQSGTDYFGLPETFTATDPYFTSDRELSEFTSDKFGIGFRRVFEPERRGWLSKLRSFETRLTTYSREDGLDAISASFAIGLRLRSFQ